MPGEQWGENTFESLLILHDLGILDLGGGCEFMEVSLGPVESSSGEQGEKPR